MAIIKAKEHYVSLFPGETVPVGFAIKAEREAPCGERWLVKESQVKVLGGAAGVHYIPREDGLVPVHKDFFDE